jgi:hypothetical protein
MVALRTFICVLLTTSIIGHASGALAAGKIRLAQTSTVTNCMVSCNNAYLVCQTSCVQPAQAQSTLNQGTFSRGNVVSNGSCISLCTSQQLLCSQTCARMSPSP